MSRWPMGRRGRDAEVRYRFHTRSLEMQPLLKRLSKATPRLSFALVTHCLDDGDFGPFSISRGRVRGKWLGDDWRTPFYERAARHFKIMLDEVYEDDEATWTAESWMRDAAMQIATRTDRRYDWTAGRVSRDLADEREAFITALAALPDTGEDDGQSRRALAAAVETRQP